MDIFHDALVQWFLTLTVMQELSFKAVFLSALIGVRITSSIGTWWWNRDLSKSLLWSEPETFASTDQGPYV